MASPAEPICRRWRPIPTPFVPSAEVNIVISTSVGRGLPPSGRGLVVLGASGSALQGLLAAAHPPGCKCAAVIINLRESSLIETPLRKTAAAHDQLADPTAPRGRLHRRARQPLSLRGRPSPTVKRHLFGTSASSSQPSPAEESLLQSFLGPRPSPFPGPSPDDAATSPPTSVLDPSVDRSQSPPVDVRPSKGHIPVPVLPVALPSPFLSPEALPKCAAAPQRSSAPCSALALANISSALYNASARQQSPAQQS
ncbi:uncharacterized protein [Palaemon carinicauda]|uniref:uncharacterized protein n=1 Tax=Palaemon carinicauda TaxID=392227 RepID=UPI0035B61764